MLDNLMDFDVVRVGRALRRTRILAAGLAAAGLVIACLLGEPLAGIGIVIGAGLGAFSTRWMDASVARLESLGSKGPKAARRPLAMRTLARLGVLTACVVLMLIFVTPMGLGALGGLVLYQIAFLSSMISAVFRGTMPR